jgi:hypothetical protein
MGAPSTSAEFCGRSGAACRSPNRKMRAAQASSPSGMSERSCSITPPMIRMRPVGCSRRNEGNPPLQGGSPR